MAEKDILGRIRAMSGVSLGELPPRMQKPTPPSKTGDEIMGFLSGAPTYRNLALRDRLAQYAKRIGVDRLDDALRAQLLKRFIQSGDLSTLPRVQGSRLRALFLGEGME